MRIRRLAAIDIGSNGMRLLIKTIYQKPNHTARFNKTSLVRMPIRLGKDVFTQGVISPENQERLKKAMLAFKLMMEVYQVEEYLAFATSAMREAKNGQEIANQIQDQCNVNLQLINGKKEAEIIFKTELQSYLQANKNYLYVDVGGGSTELTLLQHGSIIQSKSFKVGTVRMLNNKVKPGVFPEDMKQWIKTHVNKNQCEIIGSGGNINFVFKRSGNPIGVAMTANYLQEQYNQLKQTTYQERLHAYDMKPDRADVILPALRIFTKVVKWSNANYINVPKIGLSDGMIQYLFEQAKDS